MRVPFGPFLIAGFYVALLWYGPAMNVLFPRLY